MVFEHSSALRGCIDAYVGNIDGTGHRFSPVLDLESDDAEQQISDAILVERYFANKEDVPVEPSPADIKAKIDEIKLLMKLERARLQSFFDFLCYDISFTELRRRTRMDLEQSGNAYWEVVRDEDGQIATAEHVATTTMRLTKLDAVAQEVTQRVMVGPLTWKDRKTKRRFRRYIQQVGAKRTYFKELGDPRVLSPVSGKFYKSKELLASNEKDVQPASEILHFAVWSSRSPYGVPRWIGALCSILGARAAEEVNFFYFDNKSVPPLAILVSGGKITGETKEAIEEHINGDLKGRQNFHSILVIEADSDSSSVSGSSGENRTKIEMKPLTDAQHADGQFQKYEEQTGDKVGAQFRLPRMLRGIDLGYNRSTSESALLFGETQVFGPERDAFDFIINRRFLIAMEIRFFQFKSNAPGNMAPAVLTQIIKDLTNASVLTPAEARNFAEQVFGTNLRRIDELWTQQPIGLTIASLGGDTPEPVNEFGTQPKGDGEDGAGTEKKPTKKGREATARQLVEMWRKMKRAERQAVAAEMAEERSRDLDSSE